MKNLSKISFINIVLFVGIYFSSCLNIIGEKGNGNVIDREIELNEFNSINIGGAFEVIYNQSENQEVHLIADENLHELVKFDVRGKTLEISTKKIIGDATELKIMIQAPNIKSADLSGACEFSSIDTLYLETLEIESSGASEIDLLLVLENLNIEISGASEIDLAGKTNKFELDISGASEVEAFDFIAKDVIVESSGASDCEIYAKKSLRVDLSGASNVKYKGHPEKFNSDSSGASSVKRAD